jgi:hypothetical protein
VIFLTSKFYLLGEHKKFYFIEKKYKIRWYTLFTLLQNNARTIVRGAIHVCNLGLEQNKERPVLILSNDLANSIGGNVNFH